MKGQDTNIVVFQGFNAGSNLTEHFSFACI